MNAVYKISGVTKQAFHKHIDGQKDWSERLSELQVQVEEIRSLHPGCGLEKLYDTLNPTWIGRDKFISAFMNLGYRIRKKVNFTRTTIPTCMNYPNLIEGLLVWDKNRVWQSDITYFEVGGSFCYIVFIIDIYTKVIRGYQVSNHMRAEANLRALQMALRDAKEVNDLIHHSDRGSQFVDTRYREHLRQHGIHISMGIIAQDNAYSERINGIIKNEYLHYRTIGTLTHLKKEVKRAVDHYNEKRIHRHLPGKQSPRTFEKQLLHLSTQNRPKVIVYTEGNAKIRAASSRPDFNPETRPQDHVCPMVIDL
jgi:putative transposase